MTCEVCDKHDTTMEKIFDKITEMNTKIDLMLERQEVDRSDLKEVRTDLYEPEKGLFYKIGSMITKINISYSLIFLILSSVVGLLFFMIKAGLFK